MSEASTSTSSEVTPKNILWLDTHYNSAPYYMTNMNTNILWKSEKFKLPYMDVFLQFHFQRLNELEFRLTCVRNSETSEKKPYGYVLQFECFINIFDDDAKVFNMSGDQTVAYEIFLLKTLKLHKQIDFKILVKMIEYDITPTYVYLRQEDDFFEMKEMYFNSESILKDLGYILKCPTLKGIFTGRQDYDFYSLKSIYIKRTADFSEEIANYLRAKEACIPVPATDLGLILNFILNGEQASIDNKDLVKVYFEAHRMGLGYLVDLSRDCSLVRIGDQDFLMDALYASDCVNDEVLFERAAQNYRTWEKDIVNSDRWHEMSRNSSIQCRFVVYSLKRILKKNKSRNLAETGETSQSSSY